MIKGDDDDYRPYYASLEAFQFNSEGPNGATVYLKYFTLIKGVIKQLVIIAAILEKKPTSPSGEGKEIMLLYSSKHTLC